jgi:RNA polymerase sigma factor for flagellar operon FliA
LPASVQVDDLIQAGMLGLLEAARRYDPATGRHFSTFAEPRIRGAMLDEIRKGDWTPRSVHRKAREVTAAIRAVETATGREAQ